MDELNDMNLPADADDLSKHAPTLFKLKNEEEGFVVPPLYFEELSELVISKTAIPEDGGLVVPENYFEESADLIIAKTNLPGESGLTEPENYFEELPAIIQAKTVIPVESGLTEPEKYFEEFHANLEAQISLQNALPPFDSAQDDNTIPAGYFEEMERELHVHIALDNVKQDEGFVVPEGYFGELSDRILVKSSSSDFDSAQSDDADNGDPNVPEKYFEEFPSKVISRIESEEKPGAGKIIVLAQWRKYVQVTALAASVALLIGLAWLFIANRDHGDGDLLIADYSKVTRDYSPVPNVNPLPDTADVLNVQDDMIAQTPKNSQQIKPKQNKQVIMDDDAILAHVDQMDESMVIDFVIESNVIEESEQVLDADMMDYLMNDNSGFDVFDPSDRP